MVPPCPLKGICLVPSPEHLKIIQKRLDSIKCLSRTLNFVLLTKGKHINLLLLPEQQQSSNLTKRYLRIWSRLKEIAQRQEQQRPEQDQHADMVLRWKKR